MDYMGNSPVASGLPGEEPPIYRSAEPADYFTSLYGQVYPARFRFIEEHETHTDVTLLSYAFTTAEVGDTVWVWSADTGAGVDILLARAPLKFSNDLFCVQGSIPGWPFTTGDLPHSKNFFKELAPAQSYL